METQTLVCVVGWLKDWFVVVDLKKKDKWDKMLYRQELFLDSPKRHQKTNKNHEDCNTWLIAFLFDVAADEHVYTTCCTN